MKKKILLAVNVLLLAAVVICLIRITDGSGGMFPRISSKAVDKIKKNFMVTDEDILEVLSYNGRELPCDEDSGIFYLPLSMYEDAWENGRLSSGTEGVDIAFLSDVEKESKSELMKEGTRIPFYAFNGREYREYYLVITGLPVMELTTLEEAPKEDGEGLYRMRLLSVSGDTLSETASDMKMHIRGNTSQNYPKKGYKCQLVKKNASGTYAGNKQSLLGYREDDDWILYALYNDGTKIRDKLCIDIWNAYGAENNSFKGKLGTDLTYIEVVWDGAYYGIYALMEPIDSRQVNLSKEDGVHLTEYLYKRKQPASLDAESFLPGTDELMRAGFEIKGRRTQASEEDWEPLKNLIAWQEQESDELFAGQAEQFINMDNTVDMWIFTNLITGYDQIAKNMYYVAKAVNGEYRFFFAPWDMDLTWGYTSDPDYPLGTKYEGFLTSNYIWWQPGDRLMQTNAAGARDLAEERWKYLRTEILTDEWLEEEIESLKDMVVDSGAMARDEERWPEGNHDRSYEELKRYVSERMEWLDTFMGDIESGLKDW